MDYEKKYMEALERAKKLHSEPTGGTERIVCEQIFPELAESEDERIRKEILDYLVSRGFSNEWIAWLEKQGEKALHDYREASGALNKLETKKKTL